MFFDLLTDSEKVFPTATRALAALICGIDSMQTYPIPKSHDIKKESSLTLDSAVAEMLSIFYLKLDCEGGASAARVDNSPTSATLLERVRQYEGAAVSFEMLTACDSVSVDVCMPVGEISARSRRLERSIQDKPQKLVFSIIQSLGSVLWSSCNCEYSHSHKEFSISAVVVVSSAYMPAPRC